MNIITLSELEDAINYWRAQKPANGEERALSKEVNTLASVYALMIFHRQKSVAVAELDEKVLGLLQVWREQVIKL